MKRFLPFLLCVVLLGGCGFKDIDKRFFVLAIGIDTSKKIKNGYKITFKLALPSPDPKEGARNSLLVSEDGRTLSEAVRIIKSRVDKELDFGHAKLILIGEDVTKKDINLVLDWLSRRRDIQKIAWVAAGKPSAYKILKQRPTSERLPSSVLFQFFGDTGTESPYILYTYLFDFLRRIREPSLSAYLPIIQTGKDSVYEIKSTAIFRDGKKTLTLNREETKLLNIISRGYQNLDVKVKIDNEYFIVATDDVHTSYKLHTGNKPYMEMKVKLVGVVEESLHALKHNQLAYYNQLTSKVMEKRMMGLLHTLQKKKVDPIGFGLRFRATHLGNEKELLATWKKLYPELEFRVHVETDIKGTGVIQ